MLSEDRENMENLTNVPAQVQQQQQQQQPVAKKGKGSKTVEEIYTKKTQLEHILLRPDSYIGSVEKLTQQMWVYDREANKIVNKQITFVPGLYKIFDEIIVNSADNKQRDPSMNKIQVDIKPEENSIRVWNNGNGIPVVIHQEHKIYVPELIFGNLLTGSNFDDKEQKTTGGRNGYGAKLANIFSTRFIVETADKERGLKYRQEFSNNMTTTSPPKISKHSGSDYTCITFFPDLERFNMDNLDEDTVSLLSKRVFDIAGTNTAGGPKLGVYLNGTHIDARTFERYIGMYDGMEPAVSFEKVNDRWEIGVGVSDGSFQQVSFVNSICTTKGGVHVSYIADQITSRLAASVKKKNKGEEVKANQIKNHLTVFVNALVVNPSFDSQTKENLTTKQSAFGSTCIVSDKMIKQIEKSQIIDNILSWSKFKQSKDLQKKGGSKRSKVLGITKLDDANCAGTSKSLHCTLILTEGDSAKALAISGLGVVGRDYYGVFPLKGKLLNVREAAHQQILKNEEVQNIAKILGLTFGKTYDENTVKDLRYGHLMIMTDQDHDGSHIKGLLINFIHHFWPSLLKVEGFLQQFITPIVKCTKGKKEVSFYTLPEYAEWKMAHEDGKGWKVKYYKGLGTSTAAEAKDYFSNIAQHEIPFRWEEGAGNFIDMAFAKKRVDDRKLWLMNLQAGTRMNYNVDSVSYDDFINRELILFSNADNERSLPHFMDGLKPSQRKVLFSCFKRNLKQEIKVAQLAGYVSEHSAYHHGEMSLTQTIIGMAQDFVGSNNINFLTPCGQFGTRLMGGKDAASSRYVFTKLEAITRCIFHPDDDALMDYLDDDGQSIEPLFYAPIIPMALVNGSEGIGTGWSCSIPQYNPRDVIAIIRDMIHSKAPPSSIAPWYRGFSGLITPKHGAEHNFNMYGKIEQLDDTTVLISELPVGKWTTDYKQFLESCLIGGTTADGPTVAPFIKDFKENHTDTTVSFSVSIPADKLLSIVNDDKGGLIKKFKLEGSISTTNMHMFDLNSQIRKYDGPIAVLTDFYHIRIQFYDRRKAHLIEKLTTEFERLDNKVRFIMDVIEKRLVISNRKKTELLHELNTRGYKIFVDKKTLAAAKDDDDTASQVSDMSEGAIDPLLDLSSGYDYLLSMKLWNLTMEKVAELSRQREDKRTELDILISKPPEKLWLDDLDALEEALTLRDASDEEAKALSQAARKKANAARNANGGKKGGAAGRKATASSKKRKTMDSDDDSDYHAGDSDGYADTKPSKKAAATSAASRVKPEPLVLPSKTLKASSLTLPSSYSTTNAVNAPSLAATKPATTSSSMSFLAPLADQKTHVASIERTSTAESKLASAAVVPEHQGGSGEEAPLESMEDVADDAPTLSLFQRLQKQKAAQSGQTAAPAVYGSKAAGTIPKGKKVAPKKPALQGVDHDNDEDDDVFFGKPTTATSSASTTMPAKPKRAAAAAAAAKKYILDSDDDEAEASFCLPDDDEDEEKKHAKGSTKKSGTEKAKGSAREASKPGSQGTKRPAAGNNKITAAAANKNESLSSEDESPLVPAKKARPAAGKSAAAPSSKTKKAASVPAASTKKPAATKAKKSRIVDSEEEEEEASSTAGPAESVVVGTSLGSKRPTRARKAVVYNVDSDGDEDNSEEEADASDGDDDDEEEEDYSDEEDDDGGGDEDSDFDSD